MDIHTNGLAAQLAAEAAVDQIFGDDISRGPRRPIPDWLRPYVPAIGFNPAFIEIRPPASTPKLLPSVSEIISDLSLWRLYVHRVNMIANGRKVGEALRMDDVSLDVLEAFERHLRREGHVL